MYATFRRMICEHLNEFRVSDMDGNTSAKVVVYNRPSVIKWIGKDFTSDINSEPNVCDSSTLDAHTRSERERKQNKRLDESSDDQQATNNVESLFPQSSNASGKKSYSCQMCSKRFKWRSHWKSHERIHTGERPFQCEICGKAFTRSDGLQSHKKVHLKITKPCAATNQPHYVLANNNAEEEIKQDSILICAYCGRTFSSIAGYDRHKEKKHKGLKSICIHLYVFFIIFNYLVKP
jgi:DNA-directed RNA polymerase subunit RPC12/RpoP